MSKSSAQFQPLVEEISPPPVEDAFHRLAAVGHCLFLDSAATDAALGRYSFLCADPVDYWELPVGTLYATDPLDRLAAQLAPLHTLRVPGLPPFQGGAGVLLSYDLHHRFESVPFPAYDEFQLPAMAAAIYDLVLAVDHVQGRAWIVSQGLPETDPSRRTDRAAARLAWLRSVLQGPLPAGLHAPSQARSIPPSRLAPQHPCPRPWLTSNFSKQGYLSAVQRTIDYILAGDVFQVNLAQRLLAPARCGSAELYLRLRRCNPAPFAGYFDLGRAQIVSASPERFLHLADGQVETRPIKGTRPRTGEAEIDRGVAEQLRTSPKDRAENVMIVDLLRNDLSRVCLPDSVRVAQLCQIESYRHVLHLVSAVRAILAEEQKPWDLVRATFPGGSITGAPKIRAMQIIAELEPTARGPYCGCLGYVGLDGSMDLSILIRTITACAGWWQAMVGGGIVAQSIPTVEYQETWDKAEGLVQAMEAE